MEEPWDGRSHREAYRATLLFNQTMLISRKTTRITGFHAQVIDRLVRSLDRRDQMTARHSAAVARYSRKLALAAGCTLWEADLVHDAGLVHDIGKFILPDRILQSAGEPLSEEDWALIHRHPAEAVKILTAIGAYEDVATVVIAHHERVDGTGYPNRLATEEIPKLAKILAIADTYDVMTARDTYSPPVNVTSAIAELRRVSGTQLDAGLVELFIGLIDSGEIQIEQDQDFTPEPALTGADALGQVLAGQGARAAIKITELPESSRASRCSTSARCSPVVGSSSR